MEIIKLFSMIINNHDLLFKTVKIGMLFLHLKGWYHFFSLFNYGVHLYMSLTKYLAYMSEYELDFSWP